MKRTYVKKVREDVSKDGKPIPIYRLTKVDIGQQQKAFRSQVEHIKRVKM